MFLLFLIDDLVSHADIGGQRLVKSCCTDMSVGLNSFSPDYMLSVPKIYAGPHVLGWPLLPETISLYNFPSTFDSQLSQSAHSSTTTPGSTVKLDPSDSPSVGASGVKKMVTFFPQLSSPFIHSLGNRTGYFPLTLTFLQC